MRVGMTLGYTGGFTETVAELDQAGVEDTDRAVAAARAAIRRTLVATAPHFSRFQSIPWTVTTVGMRLTRGSHDSSEGPVAWKCTMS